MSEQVPPTRGRQSDVDLLPTCVDERRIFADEISTIAIVPNLEIQSHMQRAAR
jgi:hypothetical protein